MITANDIHVPADVPQSKKDTYIHNVLEITRNCGNFMLFAGDQKIEHLNDDYFGEGISPENADPEHMFRIAAQAKIGAFASQFGLIARYGKDYPEIPYIVKMNSKTHLVPTDQAEAVSRQITTFHMIDEMAAESGLKIMGVGYTIYVGSEHETLMFEEAARIAYEAHRRGMVAVFWMYPRGKAVPNEKDPHIIAGAAGVGACLGADFVKVNYPKVENGSAAESLQEAVKAAGRTKLICAGGATVGAEEYLKTLHDQIHIGGAHGTAIGRNIHQRSLEEAVRFCNAVFEIVVENKSVEEAMKTYNG